MKEHFSNSYIKGESTKNLGNINQTFRQRIYNNLKILLLRFDLFHLDYIWFMNAALSAIRVPLTDSIFETGAYRVPSKSLNPTILGYVHTRDVLDLAILWYVVFVGKC